MRDDKGQKIDATRWHYENLWRKSSLERCVRPGLRTVYTNTRYVVGGFSVINSYTDEVWHYIFDVATSGRKDLTLNIFDEDFQVFQKFLLNVDVMPRAITHAVVLDQIMICSPDFPTLWGMIGSGVQFAKAVSPVNTNFTAINVTALNVPRGICTEWNNRVVIANGPSLFFSEAVAITGGDSRTFIDDNQNSLPGIVYGLHTSAGGDLFAFTSVGTYMLPGDASAAAVVGTNGSPGWRLASHHAARSFQSSATWRGRVMGLTSDGWVNIDNEGEDEKHISQPLMPRAVGSRHAPPDFRALRMFSNDDGPIICYTNPSETSATTSGCDFYVKDVDNDIESWWTMPAYGAVVGMLSDPGGGDLLLTNKYALRATGNFDGGLALTVVSTPNFVAMGVVPGMPAANRTVRHITAMAAIGGPDSLTISSRGLTSAGAPPADPYGLTIGTDSWGTSTKRWTTTPFASVRAQFGELPTDDVSVEASVAVPGARVAQVVDVVFSESATNRPLTVAS